MRRIDFLAAIRTRLPFGPKTGMVQCLLTRRMTEQIRQELRQANLVLTGNVPVSCGSGCEVLDCVVLRMAGIDLSRCSILLGS